MNQDLGAHAGMDGRNDERLAIDRKGDVTDGGRVDDRMQVFECVGRPVGYPAEPGAVRGSGHRQAGKLKIRGARAPRASILRLTVTTCTRFMRRFLTALSLSFVFLLGGCTNNPEPEAQAEADPTMSFAEQNLADGQAFLAEVAKRPGIQTTESGLMYEVITEGEGEKPTAMSSVTVHYEGTFPNGEVFDSSYARGETISFGLRQVIPGWTEGLQLMSPGAKYKLYIPYTLGYGPRGMGPIPPNQALVFTVELFSFEG